MCQLAVALHQASCKQVRRSSTKLRRSASDSVLLPRSTLDSLGVPLIVLLLISDLYIRMPARAAKPARARPPRPRARTLLEDISTITLE